MEKQTANKQQTFVTSHCTWNGECLMKLLNSGLTWRQKETTTTLSYKAQCQRYCEIQSRNGFRDQLEYSFYISIKGLNPDAITIWLLERHTEEGLFLPTCQQPDTTPDQFLGLTKVQLLIWKAPGPNISKSDIRTIFLKAILSSSML